MTSLPPQQPQRRSPTQSETSDDQAQQARRNSTDFPSTTSIDSQTVLLGGSGNSEDTTTSVPDQQQEQDQAPQAPNPANDTSEPRRCWICFSDETEDDSPRLWRTPCPCALTAHESCLLDWIADIESPDANHSTAHQQKIECPQCKKEIYLERPRDKIVEVGGLLESLYTKALLPATLSGLTYTMIIAFKHHGMHTINTVFGYHDASIILRPVAQTPATWNWIEREAVRRFPDIFRPLLKEWRGLRVEMGLPLIPVALMLSRTRIGDAALPFLPIAFFATHSVTSHTLKLGYWPPSAALTLVLLPYARQLYSEVLERTLGEKERGWVKEVRPQLGREEQNGDGAQGQGAQADDDNDWEDADGIRIEVDIGMEDEAEEEVEAEVAVPAGDGQEQEEGNDQQQEGDQRQRNCENDEGQLPPEDIANAVDEAVREQEGEAQPEAQPNAQPDAPQEQQQPDQQQGQQQGQHQHEHRHGIERQIDLIKYAWAAADMTIGALFFPTICGISGELLRTILPRSWTRLPGHHGPPTGLMQTKWGRSIIGGCLFVVLKDAMRIYCRWRQAQSFRSRRVKDYDKVRGRYV